jgi:hypothetical protein
MNQQVSAFSNIISNLTDFSRQILFVCKIFPVVCKIFPNNNLIVRHQVLDKGISPSFEGLLMALLLRDNVAEIEKIRFN